MASINIMEGKLTPVDICQDVDFQFHNVPCYWITIFQKTSCFDIQHDKNKSMEARSTIPLLQYIAMLQDSNSVLKISTV